jgi:methylphosphotriester-DNA--protein-cysteine methyltransferase
MVTHTSLLTEKKPSLASLIRKGEIILAGNKQLKIYGTLHCKSGKRMKISNRIFFSSEQEAIDAGYRPCGHCMREKYKIWKEGNVGPGI